MGSKPHQENEHELYELYDLNEMITWLNNNHRKKTKKKNKQKTQQNQQTNCLSVFKCVFLSIFRSIVQSLLNSPEDRRVEPWGAQAASQLEYEKWIVKATGSEKVHA
mmetsp:Transcript_18160/g.31618  ORF Transcript_18160/g.31618 Transcript_18160/m.31618 type:complete len:107 (-) Transcript_18160:1064-1384(-)